MAAPPGDITIIGGGLAGLTLALSLHYFGPNIKIRVFEDKGPSHQLGGGIMLSPNALKILDTVGVYERIRARGFPFETMKFMKATSEDPADPDYYKVTDTYYFGSQERYGYKAIRIIRRLVVEEMMATAKDFGIDIEIGKALERIVSEGPDGVKFQLRGDEQVHRTDLLIGADGIHSTVRKALYPDVEPKYLGLLAVTGVIPMSQVHLPAAIPEGTMTAGPTTLATSHPAGAFVTAPEGPAASELFFGSQRPYKEPDASDGNTRKSWGDLWKDKDELYRIMSADIDKWPDVPRSIIESAGTEQNKKRLNIWALHVLPKLDRGWISNAGAGRVVLVGDAAHAVPPTTGQGANQAMEDSFALAVLLPQIGSKLPMNDGLKLWNEYREHRVGHILKLTTQINNKRLPIAEQEKLPRDQVWRADEGEGQMDWLYGADIQREVQSWISSR